MPEYLYTYQQTTGSEALSLAIGQAVTPELKAELLEAVGDQEVGVLEWQQLGAHISKPFLRAKQLAERSGLLHVVTSNLSYFTVDSSGACGGPLAPMCQPTAETARNWAFEALRYEDTGVFAAANCFLPERSSDGEA